MTARTRYFVVSSLAVLAVGLGTGLVAYYVGFPTSAFFNKGPEELRFVPSTAVVVGYADVSQVMNSELRQRLHTAIASQWQENGQHEFENATGINIETDLDHVIGCLDASNTDQPSHPSGLILARGRFNESKIEMLMRDHGATVETYKNKRIIVNPTPINDAFSLTFLEAGLAAFGSAALVHRAVDLETSGGESALTNDDLLTRIKSVDGTSAWAVGRFDVLRAKAQLPEAVANQLPPITWFVVSAQVDSGLRGAVQAEARDDAAATNLRDVVRGFLALAKLQAGSKPEMQALLQSFELGGSGKNVALSFDIPSQAFDILSTFSQKPPASSTQSQ